MNSIEEFPISLEPSDFTGPSIVRFLSARKATGAEYAISAEHYAAAQESSQTLQAERVETAFAEMRRGYERARQEREIGPLKARTLLPLRLDEVRALDREIATMATRHEAERVTMERELAARLVAAVEAARVEAARRATAVRALATWLRLGEQAGVRDLEHVAGWQAAAYLDGSAQWPATDHAVRAVLLGASPAHATRIGEGERARAADEARATAEFQTALLIRNGGSR